jgi:membrane protease YdiL (CAAX protease family)
MNSFLKDLKGNKRGGISFSIMMFSFVAFNLIVSVFLTAFKVQGLLLHCLSALAILFSALLMLVLFSKLEQENNVLSHYKTKFNPTFILISVLLSLTLIFGFGFINGLVEMFFNSIGVSSPNAEPITTFSDYILYTVFLALIPAVSEELVFRGIVLQNVKGSKVCVLVVSSLCFSLYHCSILKFFYQFICGIAIGALYLKTKNLILPTITHFFNNFIIINFTYFNISVNLFNPLYILLGLALFSVLAFFICRGLFNKDKTESAEIKRFSVAIKEFFIPYGLVGAVICVVMMIGGVIL